MHIWVQNWQIFDPKSSIITLPLAIDFAKKYIEEHEKAAIKMNKPIVLEEFGISRDLNNHDPKSSVEDRDKYYFIIFNEVYKRSLNNAGALRGVNFWAWGGEGRPNNIHGLWVAGNDFIGDPPHEFQGWYSVYDKDLSTNAIIKLFANKFIENSK